MNSFSKNYLTAPEPWGRVSLLYRLKKARGGRPALRRADRSASASESSPAAPAPRGRQAQYLLYKHALLHGLNASVAMAAAPPMLPLRRGFRLYWVCLNAAYVLEFFLQTLVRRRALRQGRMLALNATLMAASTLAAAPVVALRVRPVAAALSCALNFARRGHELGNMAALLLALAALAVIW